MGMSFGSLGTGTGMDNSIPKLREPEGNGKRLFPKCGNGKAEVKFVNAVTAGVSVKFLPAINFSIFTHFLCFFLLKRLKLGEIDGVKFLA